MKRAAVVVTALAGAALFEAALVPGVLIGAAAMLGPRLFGRSKSKARPVAATAAARPPSETAARGGAASSSQQLTLTQTLFKTITFRTIVTGLDFGSNLFVIGELAPAAGLSAYGLVAGPIFYFAHEILWNRRAAGDATANGAKFTNGPHDVYGGFHMSRALAKTITYRLFATTADFSANYFVVRDLAEAALLTSFGFITGPFVYYGHEKAWDYFTKRQGGVELAPRNVIQSSR
jgi:uncharacterized membrane protein